MSLRRANLARISGGFFDVLVVGGGINGAVSAAALAGRGANVALVDRGDFGGFTSQESSNLVWGGFKYLENYELPLVFGLCRSRNRPARSISINPGNCLDRPRGRPGSVPRLAARAASATMRGLSNCVPAPSPRPYMAYTSPDGSASTGNGTL